MRLEALVALIPEPVRAQTLMLFASTGVVLLIASTVGALLRWRLGPANVVVSNLNTRINAWWVMIGAIGVAYLGGRTGVVLLFALISFFALREFIALSQTRHGNHAALSIAALLVLPLQYLLVDQGRYGMFSIFVPVYGLLFLPVVASLRRDTTHFLARAAEAQWGLMICVYCLSHVPALLTLNIPGYAGRNLLLVSFLIIVAQSCDVLQYVWGMLFGRHRISPRLSPSKTVEGFAGGVLSSTLIGASLYWITPFSPWQAAVMALAITLAGFFGGLVMSAIKRDHGVKDWGNMIGGHGGMLDRVDSLCFSAPIFFHLIRFCFVS